jgi:hypothetical protein
VRRPIVTIDWHKTIEHDNSVPPLIRFALSVLSRYFTVLILSFVGGGPGSRRHISTFQLIVESGVSSLLLRSQPDAVWAPFRSLTGAKNAVVHFTFNRSECENRQSRDSAGRLYPTKVAYLRLIAERCGSGPVVCHIDDNDLVIYDVHAAGIDARLVQSRPQGAGHTFQKIASDIIWKFYPGR